MTRRIQSKRMVAILLTLVMVFSILLPTAAFGAEATGQGLGIQATLYQDDTTVHQNVEVLLTPGNNAKYDSGEEYFLTKVNTVYDIFSAAGEEEDLNFYISFPYNFQANGDYRKLFYNNHLRYITVLDEDGEVVIDGNTVPFVSENTTEGTDEVNDSFRDDPQALHLYVNDNKIMRVTMPHDYFEPNSIYYVIIGSGSHVNNGSELLVPVVYQITTGSKNGGGEVSAEKGQLYKHDITVNVRKAATDQTSKLEFNRYQVVDGSDNYAPGKAITQSVPGQEIRLLPQPAEGLSYSLTVTNSAGETIPFHSAVQVGGKPVDKGDVPFMMPNDDVDITMVAGYETTFAVTDGNAPITNAKITVSDGVYSYTPDEEGVYILPAGDYTYTAKADGYGDKTGSFTVSGDSQVDVALTALGEYTAQGTKTQIQMISPTDIGINMELTTEDTYHNQIIGALNPTEDLEFKIEFSGGGLGSLSEANILKTGMPNVTVYADSALTEEVASYDNGAGSLKFISFDASSSAMTMSIATDTLDGASTYYMLFNKNFQGGNRAIGVDIIFQFDTIKVGAADKTDLGNLINTVTTFKNNAKFDDEIGNYPAEEETKLVDAIAAAKTVYDNKAATTQQVNDAEKALQEAYEACLDARIVKVLSIQIDSNEIGEVQVGATGKATARVDTLPDEEQYGTVTWSASDNITINAVTGEWVANYPGAAWIKATSTVDDSQSATEEFTVAQAEAGALILHLSSGDTLEQAVATVGATPSEITKLVVSTDSGVYLKTTDFTYLKSNFVAVKEIDFSGASIQDYTINSLPAMAFQNMTTVETIVLPDNLTDMGYSAFEGCTSLKNIEIPIGVTGIKAYMFRGCTSLEELTIPAGVTSFIAETFSGCSSLTTLTMAGSTPPNPPYSGGLGGEFNGNQCGITTISVPYGAKTAYETANVWKDYTITEREEVALNVEVNVSGGLQAAAEAALQAADQTENAIGTLNISCTDGAVLNDTDRAYLQNHFLSASKIDLSGVAFANNETGEELFVKHTAMTTVILPEGLTTISKKTFNNLRNALTTVILPSTLTLIDDNAFAYCNSLVLTELPDAVETVGNNAFEQGLEMKLTKLPANLKTIGEKAFWRNEKSTISEIPEGVESIGNNAFEGCLALTVDTLPATLTSIGSQVFTNCTSMPKTIYVLAKEPPTATGVFLASRDTTVAVPPSKVSDYQTANIWKDYTITAIGADETVTVSGVTITNPTSDEIQAIQVGDTGTAKATVTVEPDKAQYQIVTWSSSDSEIVSINESTGEWEAVGAGEVTLTATSDLDPSQHHEITFTVDEVTVNEVAITSDNPGRIKVGATGKAEAEVTVTPDKEQYKGITWSSSDSEIVSINATTGEWTANAVGKATITATSTQDNTKSATQEFTVRSSGGGGGGGSSSSSTTEYTLTFDTNGGSNITAVKEAANSKIDLSDYTPTREGYTFAGWYSDAELTNAVSSITLTANTTVYAKWTEGTETPATDLPFTDVAESAWYAGAVKYAYENGLMNGTDATSFSPNASTTRGMIVTILYRQAGSPAVAENSGFADVAADTYYANPVAWAAANGVVKGYSAGEFGPNDNITREQMAQILYGYAQLQGQDVSGAAMRSFADMAQISDWAETAVAWAVSEQLLQGDDQGLLNPQGTATRAEVATILQRFLAE